MRGEAPFLIVPQWKSCCPTNCINYSGGLKSQNQTEQLKRPKWEPSLPWGLRLSHYRKQGCELSLIVPLCCLTQPRDWWPNKRWKSSLLSADSQAGTGHGGMRRKRPQWWQQKTNAAWMSLAKDKPRGLFLPSLTPLQTLSGKWPSEFLEGIFKFTSNICKFHCPPTFTWTATIEEKEEKWWWGGGVRGGWQQRREKRRKAKMSNCAFPTVLFSWHTYNLTCHSDRLTDIFQPVASEAGRVSRDTWGTLWEIKVPGAPSPFPTPTSQYRHSVGPRNF